MAAYNQKTRNPSRGSRSRGNNNIQSSIYRELHGQKFLPSEMPPSFVAQPWNSINLIVRLRQVAPVQVKISDIRTALQAQAGFTNITTVTDTKLNVQFDLRFKSYSVWAIDSSPMAMMPMDLLNSRAELCRIDSNPQKNMYARAGYKLPLAQASVTFSTFTQPSIVLLTLLNAAEYEVHVNLLWKGADTSLPTLSYVYPIDTKKRKRASIKDKLKDIKELLRVLDLSDSDDDDDPDEASTSSLPSSVQILD